MLMMGTKMLVPFLMMGTKVLVPFVEDGGQSVGPFVIRERLPFGYEVTRLVSKSEGLEARDLVHCIPSMILH